MTWDEALNAAGVTVNSVLRQPGHIYYHLDIREIPGAQIAHTLAQTALPPPEALKGSSETGDQGQGTEGAKDKGKGTKPPSDVKDAAEAKEVEANAKEAKAKTKEADPKAKDTLNTSKARKKLLLLRRPRLNN